MANIQAGQPFNNFSSGFMQGYNPQVQPQMPAMQDASAFNKLNGSQFGSMGDFANPVQAGNGTGGTPWMENWFGNDKQIGKANALLGVGSSLINGFLGWKQYGLEKDKFAFEKDAYEDNYRNQLTGYNTQIEDRANSRKYADSNYDATGFINKNSLT